MSVASRRTPTSSSLSALPLATGHPEGARDVPKVVIAYCAAIADEPVYGPALIHWTEKLELSLARADGTAFALPLLSTMLTA